MPTSQSATAKEVTNKLVTVLKRLVVRTDKITKVFPMMTTIINKQNSTANMRRGRVNWPSSGPSMMFRESLVSMFTIGKLKFSSNLSNIMSLLSPFCISSWCIVINCLMFAPFVVEIISGFDVELINNCSLLLSWIKHLSSEQSASIPLIKRLCASFFYFELNFTFFPWK